jgi:G3E family GTPase
MMRTPVVLLAGVNPEAMATTMIGLQFDLPDAVAVRHHIDPDRQVLTRTVSDVSGIIEEHETFLEHACVNCAIREDILPTLERLARAKKWRSIIAHLPVGAEPEHLSNALAWDTRLARFIRVSSVLVALGAEHPINDLLGEDLLAERGLHSGDDDRRGVGEVLTGMVEYADVLTFAGEADPLARGLVRTLARPGATLADETGVDSAALVGRLHQNSVSDAWVSPTRRDALPDHRNEGVWQLDLQSLRPFHPERLLDSLEALGSGMHRGRGCFWLPTRPDRAVEWAGSGGQLSIGDHCGWGARTPFTRIVLTGVGVPPEGIRDAFDSLLLAPGEQLPPVAEDGFEPWLGPIREVA